MRAGRGTSHEINSVLDVGRRCGARLNGHCLYCDAAATLEQRNTRSIFDCSLRGHPAPRRKSHPTARTVWVEGEKIASSRSYLKPKADEIADAQRGESNIRIGIARRFDSAFVV